MAGNRIRGVIAALASIALLGVARASAATSPTVLYTYDLDGRVATALYLNGQNGTPATCVS